MVIGIVIVSHNSAGVLGACLKSIPLGHEVVVIDNASCDGSASIAAHAGAKVLQNDVNVGFGAACNIGARLLSGSHVLFLNPDTILEEGAIVELELALQRYPEAGAMGPKIVLPDGVESFRYQSHIENQGRRYVTAKEAPAGDCCVQFIDGAAMLCSREVFLSLGGFDERFFLYYEDDDLSFRLKNAGWSLIYVPSAVINHHKKLSSKSSLSLDYIRAWYETASRIELSRKYSLPFDARRFRRRAILRLIRAMLTANPRKAVRYWANFLASS